MVPLPVLHESPKVGRNAGKFLGNSQHLQRIFERLLPLEHGRHLLRLPKKLQSEFANRGAIDRYFFDSLLHQLFEVSHSRHQPQVLGKVGIDLAEQRDFYYVEVVGQLFLVLPDPLPLRK